MTSVWIAHGHCIDIDPLGQVTSIRSGSLNAVVQLTKIALVSIARPPLVFMKLKRQYAFTHIVRVIVGILTLYQKPPLLHNNLNSLLWAM